MAIPILTLLQAVPGTLKLVQSIVDRAKSEGLMNAGAAKEFRGAVTTIDRKVADAIAASAAFSHDADSVRNDPNNRDNG